MPRPPGGAASLVSELRNREARAQLARAAGRDGGDVGGGVRGLDADEALVGVGRHVAETGGLGDPGIPDHRRRRGATIVDVDAAAVAVIEEGDDGGAFVDAVDLAVDCDGSRLALAGDSAHGMHPIAGQGLNMGLRDVAALADVLTDAKAESRDFGDRRVLARYERLRRFDNAMMLAATDGLNRLFSNDIAPVRLARDLGLAAVNRIPALKRLFMRHAMGLLGDLPSLMRG